MGRIGHVVDDLLREWEAFRAQREERLTAPHGFHSITGLHWLDAKPKRYDGAPGTWWLGADGVEVELVPDQVLTVGGRATAERLSFAIEAGEQDPKSVPSAQQ